MPNLPFSPTSALVPTDGPYSALVGQPSTWGDSEIPVQPRPWERRPGIEKYLNVLCTCPLTIGKLPPSNLAPAELVNRSFRPPPPAKLLWWEPKRLMDQFATIPHNKLMSKCCFYFNLSYDLCFQLSDNKTVGISIFLLTMLFLVRFLAKSCVISIISVEIMCPYPLQLFGAKL